MNKHPVISRIPPVINLSETAQRQPPAETKCASCTHFGDFITGAEHCDKHNQNSIQRDGRNIILHCTGYQANA